jgi:hypothetical protein
MMGAMGLMVAQAYRSPSEVSSTTERNSRLITTTQPHHGNNT